MEGLDSLFTVGLESYEAATFSFNVLDSSNNSPQFEVVCKESPSASTDFDRTGEVVWPVSVLLSQFLLSYAPLKRRIEDAQRNTTPLRLVELGAGVGLPSAALLSYHPTGSLELRATDGHEAYIQSERPDGSVEPGILSVNLADYSPAARALPLLWGKTADAASCLRSLPSPGSSFDVLYAADVVQWPAVVEPLALTIHALLYPSSGTPSPDPPVVYLGVVERDDGTLKRRLFALLSSFGFTEAREIPNDEYLPPDPDCPSTYLFPARGAEFGGRECKIYELLLTDLSAKPTLLEPSAADKLLTSGFEQTMTLPCNNKAFTDPDPVPDPDVDHPPNPPLPAHLLKHHTITLPPSSLDVISTSILTLLQSLPSLGANSLIPPVPDSKPSRPSLRCSRTSKCANVYTKL